MRGVQSFPPEQGADAAGLLFGLIGLGQDSLLVLAREDAALRPGDDLGIRAPGADRGRSNLASTPPRTFSGARLRVSAEGLRVWLTAYAGWVVPLAVAECAVAVQVTD